LDFIAILLKFALNLKFARHLIRQGVVLVNSQPAKESYSVFLGDIIRLKNPGNMSNTSLIPLDLIRNINAHAPRVGSSIFYQRRLRVPGFFEYNRRVSAGTIFRLPWYYEVRGKLINKENLLLLARGPHSI
jgi:ribosomal protein S4